jgi:hypothetical protein
VLQKFDDKAKSLMLLGNIALASQEGEKNEPVLEIKKLAAPLEGSKVTIHMDRINSKVADIPLLQFFKEPIEISYGLTPDHILFFSMLPNFEQALAAKKPINFPLFSLVDSWGMEPGNIAFIDGTAAGAFLERVADFLRSTKKFSQSEEQTYALLKKHLSPIEGFIQVGQGDGKSIKGKAFLKIAP